MSSSNYFRGNVKIGVLGGIGPEATAKFYDNLFRRLQERGVKSNTSYPQVIINSIPAPELVGREISETQLLPYRIGLMQLDNLDVNFIAMVCNTIHLYRDRLQEGINAPIIDLRNKVRERLLKKGIKKVAVLGTRPTIEQGLYDFPGIKNTLFSDEIMDLESAIINYNRGEGRNSQTHVVKYIAIENLQRGAEAVLLGCTELAIMLKDFDIPKIDTIDVLVDATIEAIGQEKDRRRIMLRHDVDRNQGATSENLGGNVEPIDERERKRRAIVQYSFENPPFITEEDF